MSKHIEYWDNNIVHRHIGIEINWINQHLSEKNINKINYIDIGCNVGKFYDILSQKYEIEQCLMIEPSKNLFKYIQNKYLNNENIKLYNFAISDTDGNFQFHDSVTDVWEIDLNENNINLGLSKLQKNKGDTLCVSMDNFMRNYCTIEPNKITFIKIDTENRDLNIINNMINFFKEKKINPLIIFENNFHNDMSFDAALNIINRFSDECGYNRVNIETPGDNLIKPK
jgi:FkbM family methyltransferase